MKIDREKYLLARANACMSIKDLVAAGIPRDTLYRAERKNVRPETAGKIAEALGVDVTEIIEN
ncbi:MAG: helix-turn-helix transcriptional regulator [Lachnospiraceae bacterium]|nr:helix-turn-helix transcriptional regulator [Lachnospiraceae bacterium]